MLPNIRSNCFLYLRIANFQHFVFSLHILFLIFFHRRKFENHVVALARGQEVDRDQIHGHGPDPDLVPDPPQDLQGGTTVIF